MWLVLSTVAAGVLTAADVAALPTRGVRSLPALFRFYDDSIHEYLALEFICFLAILVFTVTQLSLIKVRSISDALFYKLTTIKNGFVLVKLCSDLVIVQHCKN